MDDLEYQPVAHHHDAFLEKAREREGFTAAYDGLADQYLLARELLALVDTGPLRGIRGRTGDDREGGCHDRRG